MIITGDIPPRLAHHVLLQYYEIPSQVFIVWYCRPTCTADGGWQVAHTVGRDDHLVQSTEHCNTSISKRRDPGPHFDKFPPSLPRYASLSLVVSFSPQAFCIQCRLSAFNASADPLDQWSLYFFLVSPILTCNITKSWHTTFFFRLLCFLELLYM